MSIQSHSTRMPLVVAIALVGCATWRPHAGLDTSTSVAGHVLLVTNSEAIELEDTCAHGDEIMGRPISRWTFTRDLDHSAVDYLLRTNDSPGDVAGRLSWDSADAGDEDVRVPIADVIVLRSYDARVGLTVVAVLGILATVFLVGGAILAAAVGPSCGRPLRVRGRQVVTGLACATEATGWSEPIVLAPVPERARRVLSEVWTLEARAEHAAVAAFSKASLELMALGAPPDLVVRANRAAIQEVEHARLCFAVASAYGGKRLAPAPLPQALAGDTPDLVRLACESLLDGCLREGLASQIANLGAQSARDPEIVRVLRVQAKEEAQHAAFSWAIVEWALGRGGEPLRRRLLAQVEKLDFPRCDDLPEHGRVGRAVVEPLFERTRAEARERLRGPVALSPALLTA